VLEFRDCDLKDIEEKYIEGEPKVTINTVPIAPDLTNAARKVTTKIKGDRNEDGSDTEGTITDLHHLAGDGCSKRRFELHPQI
jgi:hypothetical protein